MPLRRKLREVVGLRPEDARLGTTNASGTAHPRSSSPIRTTNLADNPAFHAALHQRLQSFTDSEKELFIKGTREVTPEEFISIIRDYDVDDHNNSQFRQCAERIERVLRVVAQFIQGVAIGIQSNPEISSLVVGAIQFIVFASLNFVTFLTRLTDMIVRISEHVEHLGEYSKGSQEPGLIQTATAGVYGDLIDFCRKATRVFLDENGKPRKISPVRHFLLSQWRPFESEFGTIESSFQHHLNVLLHSAQAQQLNAVKTGNREANEERLRVQKNERILERKECLSWISDHDNYETDHESTYTKRQAGTGKWFIESDKFENWHGKQTSSLLWCFGKPGAGKSVLASIAIDHLTSQGVCTPRTNIVFAYIKYDFLESQQPTLILRSLIKQLSWTEDPLPQCLLDFYHLYERNARTPTFYQYEEIFIQLAHSYDTIFIVLDALDECEADQREKILSFISNVVKQLTCAKVLVTSRRETDIEQAVSKQAAPVIEIKGKSVTDDIRRYVTNRVQKMPYLKDLALFEDSDLDSVVIETLVARSEGMFLWAHLQLENIAQLRSRGDIKRELALLPHGLENTYDRIIRQIDNQSQFKRAIAQKALMWVMYSETPILVEEFIGALCVDKSCKTLLDLEDNIYHHTVITESCGNLLVIEKEFPGSRGVHFRFAHYSIREYLENASRRRFNLDFDASNYFLSFKTAQARLAEVCMIYINILSQEKDLDLGKNEVSLFAHYPFTYFDIHLQRAGDAPGYIQELLRQMLANNRSVEKILEFRLYDASAGLVNPVNSTSDIQNPSAGMLIYSTALYDLPCLSKMIEDIGIPPYALNHASLGGSTTAVARLIEQGEDVEGLDEFGHTPLWNAVSKGHDRITRQLAKAGADVNKPFHGTAKFPLHIASTKKHYNLVNTLLELGADINSREQSGETALCMVAHRDYEMTKLLLEAKADINIQGGYYGNPLQAAASTGNLQTMQLLLEAGADVNVQGGYYGNALQAAACQKDFQTARLLLEAGADVNSQGGYYGNALQAAAFTGNLQTMQLLLEAGADVNAQGGYYGSALQAAACQKDCQMARLLLEAGADVNAQGGKYGSALHAAASTGNPQMMQLVLESGANVNVQGGSYGSALQAAAVQKDIEIMRLLLEAGADVNIQGGLYGNALQAAVYKDKPTGDLQIMHLLLEAGAGVNAQGGKYGNALQAAAFSENYQATQELLEAGADVNASGGFCSSALHGASMSNDLAIVRLLIKAGADPDGKALASATKRGNIEIVTELLKAGADVNAHRPYLPGNGTILSYARYKGHEKIVELLLEKGATDQEGLMEGRIPTVDMDKEKNAKDK